jgi:hypothetical protein
VRRRALAAPQNWIGRCYTHRRGKATISAKAMRAARADGPVPLAATTFATLSKTLHQVRKFLAEQYHSPSACAWPDA